MSLRTQTRLLPPGVVSGILLILFGMAFLLDHLGIIRFDRVFEFWPVLIILVGVLKIANESDYFFGILAIFVGAFFLLHTLHIASLSWGAIWPLILIIAGVFLVFDRLKMPSLPTMNRPPTQGGDYRNTLNEYALFGSIERKLSVPDFRGGTINSTFGGVEIDLRAAEIDGDEAHLFIDATFGGVELIVPERWMVIFQGQNVFGGYVDETRTPVPDPTGAPRKKLILEGRAIFGGITIKN